VLVQNASPKRSEVQMPDVGSVVADGDDARRAPQGVILAVSNQFLKIFGTNYSPSKYHQTTLFDIFSDIPSGIRILSHKFSEILCGILSGISSEILCS